MQEVIVRRLDLYDELLTEPLGLKDGHFPLPTRPGWGFDNVPYAERSHPPEMMPAVIESSPVLRLSGRRSVGADRRPTAR